MSRNGVGSLDTGLSSLNLASSVEHDEAHDAFKSVIRRHHHARDITNEFSQAVKVLTTGQLVKDESFSLFESVQALEIMDPKMDSGYLKPGETLDDDYPITRRLLPTEILAIMDQLLCYEISWYQGYPLAQNLFTSHHIDYLLSQTRPEKSMPTFRQGYGGEEPDVLLEGVLRAYCIGVIKCCDIVIEMVAGQQYYEEEDFNTNTFNRKLLVDVDDDACLRLLAQSVKYLQKLKPNDIDPAVRDALATRLEMRQDLITTFLPNESISYTSKDWTRLAKQVEIVLTTHDLGKPVPDAFSAKIQRRLASTAPPRAIVEVKFEEACQQLKMLCTDLEEVLRLGKIWTDDASFPLSNLMTTCLSLTNRPHPPLSITRSFLQTLLFAPGRLADSRTTNNMQALLLDALRQTLPSPDTIDESWWGVEAPNDWRYKLVADVEAFLMETASVVENVLRALCQNPTRIRRCLTNVLEEVDALLTRLQIRYNLPSNRSYPPPSRQSSAATTTQLITTSIFHYIHRLELQLIIWITTLGLEQDIHVPHEMGHMYSFLAHTLTLLTPSHTTHQAHLSLHRPSSHTTTTTSPTTHLAPQTAFADALSHLYTALNLLSPTNKPSPYIKPDLQWELRMKPFSRLSHFSIPTIPAPPPPHAQEGSNTAIDVETTLLKAQKEIEQAKTGYISLLQTPLPASTDAGIGEAKIANAITLGCLATEEQWKRCVKAEMRGVVGAGLVVARVLAYVRDLKSMVVRGESERKMEGREGGEGEGGEEGKRKKLRWYVEEVGDDGVRKGGAGGGFGGVWVVPVVVVE